MGPALLTHSLQDNTGGKVDLPTNSIYARRSEDNDVATTMVYTPGDEQQTHKQAENGMAYTLPFFFVVLYNVGQLIDR